MRNKFIQTQLIYWENNYMFSSSFSAQATRASCDNRSVTCHCQNSYYCCWTLVGGRSAKKRIIYIGQIGDRTEEKIYVRVKLTLLCSNTKSVFVYAAMFAKLTLIEPYWGGGP